MARSKSNRVRKTHRKLAVENLESRAMLAGNVSAFVRGGNLFINGDNRANEIEIERTGSNTVTITSTDGSTTVNGAEASVINGVRKGFNINMRGGADVVRFIDGADEPFRINGNLIIKTDGGSDVIDLASTNVTGSLIINTGSGNDDIFANGMRVGRQTNVITGNGNDEIEVTESRFVKNVVVNMGKGRDHLLVNDSNFRSRTVAIGGLDRDRFDSAGNTFRHKPVVVLFDSRGRGTAEPPANASPTISNVADRTTPEDTSTGAVTFTVGDAETAAASLTVTGSSNNTTLVPNANIVFGGSGANRTVTITPAANQTGTATITLTVNDGNGGSASDTFVLTVTAANDAPVVTTTAGNLAYTENQAPTAIDPGLTVTDPDSANLTGATVAITTGFVAAEDVLGFTNQSGITGVYNPATGVLTLTGTATVAQYQAALRSVTYSNTSENPTTAARTVTFTANDGTATGSATRGITVAAATEPPVVTANASPLAYTENGAAVPIDPTLTVTDADSANLTGATVAITTGFAAGQDVLGFTNQAGITGSYNATTGVLTLTGTATVAAYETALRTVTYSNTSDNPSTTTRTVTFTASDGSATGSDTRDITVTAANDAPVVTATTTALTYAENQAATPIDPALTVTDADSANLTGATVAITAGFASGEDVLAFTDQAGITGVYNPATGVLTLTGTATVAAYQTALRTVTYANTSETPSTTTRTVTFTANDGTATGSDTRDLTLTAANDAPVVTATVADLAYDENDPPTPIDPGLTITDADSTNLTGATVAITTGFAAGEDVLGFTNQGGITGTYNATTGVLTLTGSATVAAYQTALRTVTYENTSEDPSTTTRTVTFTANDGVATGSDTRDITVIAAAEAPVVAATDGNLAYAANDPATPIDPALSVTDADSANLTGATVAITTGFATGQDVLNFTNQGGITGVYNPATGVLTLSGTAPVATYQTALRSVTYENTSGSPSTATRTVTFTASDGTATGSDTRNITVTPVGAPTATITAPTYAATEQTALPLQGTGMSIADSDAGAADVTATVSVVSGTITAAAGTTGVVVAGSGTNSVTLTGTVAEINDLLAGTNGGTLSYINNSDAPPATDTLTLSVNDGTTTGSDTATINITAVNDAPVVTATAAPLAYTENDPATPVDPALTVTDADSANLTGATVAITTGFATGEDVLGFTNQAGITGVYNPATGVLTLTGSATVAQYETALRSVTYANTSETPSTTTRTVTFTVNDGALTGSDTRDITVAAANEAPTATITAPTYLATEQTALPLQGTGMSIADADAAATDVTATVSVVSGTITAAAGTTGVVVGGSGTSSVTLTGTVAEINDLLAGTNGGTLSYINNIDAPPATDTLTLSVNDGTATGSDTATINITAVNDAPVVTATVADLAYTEDQAATPVDPGLTVTDPDSTNLIGATVAITAGFVATEDVLAFTNQGGIVGAYNAATGVLTLTGVATPAAYQTALRSVTYENTSDTPSTTTRTVTFTVDDGTATDSDARDIVITLDNDAPTAAITLTNYTATEQTSLALQGSGLSVDDIDAGTGDVTATASVISGTLSATAAGTGVVVGGSGTNTVTLTGTLDEINNLLAGGNGGTLSYIINSNAPPTTDTFTLLINDGGNTGGPAETGSDTATISITPVNDGPTATITQDPYAATENVALPLQGTGITVADPDAGTNEVTATVSVTFGTLTAAAGTSGVVVADSGTSTLTLTGTIAEINDLLAGNNGGTLSYIANSDTPPPDATLTFSVNDFGSTGGIPLSGSDTATINITAVNDAPVVTAAATTLTYTEDDAPVAIDPSLTVTDADSTNLAGATVAITTGFQSAQDVLGFTNQNGIIGAYNPVTGILTLTGIASLAAYQQALSSVTYENTSDNPTAGTRTVTFTANDGTNTGSDTRDISVVAVNDPPVAVDDTNTVIEDSGIDATGNVLTDGTDDSDGGDGGALTVAAVDGVTTNVGIVVPGENGFGTFTINSNGTYTYDLDDTDAAVDALLTGQTLEDFIDYNVSDTIAQDVGRLTITIQGNG